MRKAATPFPVETPSVNILASALICGDGIDLVVKRAGHRSFTVQLSVVDANRLADAVRSAAEESPNL